MCANYRFPSWTFQFCLGYPDPNVRFCREGLTARPAASSSSSEISLQIDPITADLDDHIVGLRGQVRKLRGVSIVMNLYEQTLLWKVVKIWCLNETGVAS